MTIKSSSSSLEEPPSLSADENILKNHCNKIKNDLLDEQIKLAWRISPLPFFISSQELDLLHKLGKSLLNFYKVQNKLYFESIKGIQPQWISAYLDQGKPQQIIEFGRMNRFKSSLPGIIRPDLILTQGGMIISELDSVPGGFGITHQLNTSYDKLGFSVVGGPKGMTGGFKEMLHSLTRTSKSKGADLRLGMIVSEESNDYRPEMVSFTKALNGSDLSAQVYQPQEVYFTEESVYVKKDQTEAPINILYRFFELFDYKNIPKIDLFLYAIKKEKVIATPPVKAFLEEKMWFALFHQPVLRMFWEKELGEETFSFLHPLIPKTWILDPRELPPYGIIPDLMIRQKQVSHWKELSDAGQKERRFVIKPSGFSEFAWGARGVKIGHDLSSHDWSESLEKALSSFYQTPHILQEFHQGKTVELDYLDSATQTLAKMNGRVRLCPYYFTIENDVLLGGILATICPADKKIIHGMADAIMAPCGIKTEENGG